MVETIWPPNKNLRPRDSQRGKLYKAEEWAWANTGHLRTFRSRKDIDEWVAEITGSNWWRNQTSQTVAVWHVNYSQRPSSRPYGIKIPSWIWRNGERRGPWVIVHELCHVVLWKRLPRIPWHGREFAKLYLEAVRRRLGPEAAEKLRQGYRLYRVHYRKRRSDAKD